MYAEEVEKCCIPQKGEVWGKRIASSTLYSYEADERSSAGLFGTCSQLVMVRAEATEYHGVAGRMYKLKLLLP